MVTPLTPDECVAAVVRTYNRYRKQGVPSVEAIVLTAEALKVREDAVTLVVWNQPEGDES